MVAKTKRIKKTKVRPPRVYRNKSGKPYIIQKGKKYYLNFGNKTNDMSTLQIVKLFMKYLSRPNKPRERGDTPKAKKKTKKEDLRKVQSLSEIEQNTRTAIQDHLDKLRKEKYEGIEAIEKKEKTAREDLEEEKKRQERKDIADAKERQDIKDREHKRELAEIKERQEEKDREQKKEQRLIQELNAERLHRQGLLTAPVAQPIIAKPNPPSTINKPKKTATTSSPKITDITDKVNKQEKDLEEEKRRIIIDEKFPEKTRKKRVKKMKTHIIINHLQKACINIPIIKNKGSNDYATSLKRWLYTQKITENISSVKDGWDKLDQFTTK